MTQDKRISVRAQILSLMAKLGPVSARGLASYTDHSIKRVNAQQSLRKGARAGVFEELEGAPGVYRPTSRALEQLAQTTAQE